MSAVDEARRVAADMLRQAGDETGARVLERAGGFVQHVHDVLLTQYAHHVRQEAFDLCAYLDPAWAEAEVERARGEALEMHEVWKRAARQRWQELRELSDSLLPRRPPFVSPEARYRLLVAADAFVRRVAGEDEPVTPPASPPPAR